MKTLTLLVLAMRPRQWTKNMLLFAGLILSGKIAHIERFWDAGLGFVVFCGLSGAVYLLNDLQDVEGDRSHPEKCRRPLASGQLEVNQAWLGLIGVSLAGLALAWTLNPRFFLASAAYLGTMFLYSLWLKHIVIADLFVVAGGFVLRAVAGVLAVEQPGETLAITPWFLGCLFFGALLIVTCKRRHELVIMAERAKTHRRVLGHYSLPLLDQMISVATSACVVSYSLYAIIGPSAGRAYGFLLVPSIPLVLFGIFRYLYLVYSRGEGGAPENLLLRDRPILGTVLIWLILVAAVYAFPASAPQ